MINDAGEAEVEKMNRETWLQNPHCALGVGADEAAIDRRREPRRIDRFRCMDTGFARLGRRRREACGPERNFRAVARICPNMRGVVVQFNDYTSIFTMHYAVKAADQFRFVARLCRRGD